MLSTNLYLMKIATCPPGVQGACLDIMSIYWNTPLFLAHKAYVTLVQQIYIDHCTMEGLSLTGNIQGSPADALVAIFKAKTINEVMKWVDNFIFFHVLIDHPYPSTTLMPFWYSYNLSTILSITNPLGVPWYPIDFKKTGLWLLNPVHRLQLVT